MSSVVFWIVAIGIWLAGVFCIAALSNAIFEALSEAMIFSGLAGALWGLVAHAIGSSVYDNFVD
jgi:hypothetical protein